MRQSADRGAIKKPTLAGEVRGAKEFYLRITRNDVFVQSELFGRMTSYVRLKINSWLEKFRHNVVEDSLARKRPLLQGSDYAG